MSGEVAIGGRLLAILASSTICNILNYIAQRFNDAMNLAKRCTVLLMIKQPWSELLVRLARRAIRRGLRILRNAGITYTRNSWTGLPASRGASVPSEFQNLLELAARYADEPVEKYRRFVDEYVAQVDAIYDRIPAAIATGKPIEYRG